MFRKSALSIVAAATLVTSPMPALSMPRGSGLPVIENPALQQVYHRKRRRTAYYRRRHHHHHNNGAVIAGIIGLGTVLALTANRNRYYGGYYGSPTIAYGSYDWRLACSRKYRSFEWDTGLYTTYRGYKRRCQLP